MENFDLSKTVEEPLELEENHETVNDETISGPEEEIVALAEVSIPDFPTPFFHASNPDGTRSAVKLSELKDYLNSLK